MNTDPHPDRDKSMAVSPPKPILVSGVVSAALGLIAAVFGLAVAFAAVVGRSFPGLSSPATAVAFLAFGGTFALAGWSLLRGKSWGRGVIVIFCLLLLPIAYGIVEDSRQPLYGYPLGAAVLTDLICLFVPSSLRWAQDNRTF
ncbi:hypothetical protein [Segniliparus rugosus]|uniref:Integral membrane protein n=1 Tax=Segniliparus rugosus (strain ATCC BAA-974 / DSM 45345 / CCUG 50838 / CIP 108380 / JCM 13579 / CDC 945) TaxID=679197 RepID=E5XQ22_SEGRC|nr:hypothetical protein [Segniliparus rugosus]EFV13555.1 hypothetical protein HMPREF9336_01594 [Segniliparus rugosus ATCC BAA-974]